MADHDQADEHSQADSAKVPTAKWGAACAACAMAKAKCIRSSPDAGAKCDRCQRLRKECTGQVHRPRKKRQAKPSRTAQIEERLNGLVNLLQASGELSHTNGRSSLTTLSDVAAREHTAMAQDTPSASSAASGHASTSSWVIPETYNIHGIPGCLCRPEPGIAPPPPDPDDVLLECFRTQLQPAFPFVIVPPSVSAAELQTSMPFLMAAIRMVTSVKSCRSMSAQMFRLVSHVADRVLLQSARSLEILQGIVVMIAWHHYHCLMHSQVNNLLALASSMVADLGLNCVPVVRDQARIVVGMPAEPSGRTNDERRALLAVWFLTCNLSLTCSRIEPLKYTPYIQNCIRVLENEREYESDMALVYMVRIQRLTERIVEITAKDRGEEEIPGIPSAPMSAYIPALQSEIDRLRSRLPPKLRNDSLYLNYLHTASLFLYEPPAVDIDLVNSLAQSITAGSIGQGTQLDKLYLASTAIRSWFENWSLIPASSYFRIPVCNMSQLIYALTMLGRWAQLATPRTVYEEGTPMPVSESGSMYASDAHMATNAVSERKAAVRFGSGEQRTYQGSDADLVQAVASLQLQLQSQPGLGINIPEILSTICERCEQANHLLQQTFPGDEKADNSMWTFCALKIRITRMKLERWAEGVAAAAESFGRVDQGNQAQQWRGSYPQTPSATTTIPSGVPVNSGFAQDQTQIQNFLENTIWTSDMLDTMDTIDPTVWFDGYLDWGSLVMNPMGTSLGAAGPQV